jgi:S-DNA-T family DNA segregation ATPase FtsK/SpoIIIE
LFIISDEFAELKSQQSSFMQELISTARIGRSLGVHLILATQKPSGIVDDQIWSNSKFKVCLKVQERADSMDVIKCPDAVTLKNPGRFYLQVGYNDYFAMGQAAYAGTKYVPKDKIAKTVDRNVSFINNIGDTYRNIETVQRVEGISLGEELPNILKYICDAAASKDLKAKKLWLDKIPAEIFVTNLIRKYSFTPKLWEITAVVGEYDDPNNQKQGLLTVDFADTGNTLVYGAIGKEIMLSSIVYSLIINHSSDEVNIYILDFGNEMFGSFSSAPQVGDVIFLNEDEKVVNLFATIAKELERRKKLFADYNGSYNIYIKNSGKTLPRLLVFINNYESLCENYEDYVDTIASLSREGDKYGISFIITATGANSVRGKTAQNFNHQFCLQFNDPSDYMSILGLTHGMVPSEIDGRGLVKLDGTIFEFQTAYPYKWDEINIFIKNVCAQLNQLLSKRASQISILPNHVRLLDINNNINGIDNTPIGIEKSSLSISTYDFAKHPISLVSAQETSILEKFLPSLGQVFQNMHNVELYMIDSNDNIKDTATFKHYYNSSNMKEMYSVLEKLSEETNKTNIIIIYEIEPFINSFDSEKQRKLKTMLSNLKNKKDIRVIIADSISKIKMFEYEDFYKNCVQPTNAIWVGNGIVDQFTIKSSTYNKETRSQIPSDFGYKVDKGTSTLVKLLDFYTEE